MLHISVDLKTGLQFVDRFIRSIVLIYSRWDADERSNTSLMRKILITLRAAIPPKQRRYISVHQKTYAYLNDHWVSGRSGASFPLCCGARCTRHKMDVCPFSVYLRHFHITHVQAEYWTCIDFQHTFDVTNVSDSAQ